MGQMISRTQRELTPKEIRQLTDTYHSWRGDKNAGKYDDIPGFCKATDLQTIATHGFILTPGRYVGSVDVPDEQPELFTQKMQNLCTTLEQQFTENSRLNVRIRLSLKELGYGR
jgi:type I restriction enzyme M protein